MKNLLVGALVVACLAAGGGLIVIQPTVQAQTAPQGSCLLPDGSWCWPSQPTSYGRQCQCPDGRSGIGQ